MTAARRTRSLLCGTPAPKPGGIRLRVFTMNIWNFSGLFERRQRLLRDGIRALDPDLLAFQEAGYDGTRDQVREMLDGLGYHVVHQFDGLTSLPGRDGCAIASRWPVDRLETLSLQQTPRAQGYPYAALFVRARVPAPIGPVLFVCAKPSWERNREYERERQAVALAAAIARHANPDAVPPLLGGDFDATPDSASIRFLTGRQSLDGMSVQFRDAWEEGGDGTPGYTWTYRNGSARDVIERCFQDRHHERRIDYLFVGSPHESARRVRVRKARVVLRSPRAGVWPSDHYAVYAEIEVIP